MNEIIYEHINEVFVCEKIKIEQHPLFSDGIRITLGTEKESKYLYLLSHEEALKMSVAIQEYIGNADK